MEVILKLIIRKSKNMFEIINSDWVRFILIVVFPLLAGVVGCIAGWRSLKNNVHENKIKEINLLLDKSKSGNRNAFLEFGKVYKDFKSEETEIEAEVINEKYREMKKSWTDYFRDPNRRHLRYIDIKTKKAKKWSMEHLYFIILPSNGQRFSGDDKKGVLNEIAINNYDYFVEYLFEIATNSNSIFLSISAAHAISIITNYEAYQSNPSLYISHEKSFEYDIPEFKKLKEWWGEKGSIQKKYKCPFGAILTNNSNYYHYDFGSENETRLKNLKEILSEYPRLSRTRAELAYLILDGKETYDEVKANALKSIEESETEPLPYLLLAYVAKEKNEDDNYRYWIKILKEKFAPKDILSCLNQKKFYKNNFLNSFPLQNIKKDRD